MLHLWKTTDRRSFEVTGLLFHHSTEYSITEEDQQIKKSRMYNLMT